jgi:integrase
MEIAAMSKNTVGHKESDKSLAPVWHQETDEKKPDRRELTDRTLKSLRAADAGHIWDSSREAPSGFGVRVSDTGRRTFILKAIFPGSKYPARRAIGAYPDTELADARETAKEWKKQIAKGINPADVEEKARQAELRKRADTFSSVLKEYLLKRVVGPNRDKPKQRNGLEVKRGLELAFEPIWRDCPITSITTSNVRDVIEDVRDYGTLKMLEKRDIKDKDGKKIKAALAPAPGQARNLLIYLKTFFSWAIDQEKYGLEVSPCDRLKAERLEVLPNPQHRILNDRELAAFWRAMRRMPYPYGPLYQLLILSGLRLNEVADASWAEFELDKKLWTIPAERMKGKAGKAKPHAVPLTAEMVKILDGLPRFTKGQHLFSTDFGEKSVWVNDKVKQRLDRRMLRTLRAMARKNGDDADKVRLEHWVNHDLRRTLRSGLSQLRVNSDIAEAVLAHVKPGIRGVYDRYDLLNEKREALELWSAHLRDIIEPPPANVVKLPKARGR